VTVGGYQGYDGFRSELFTPGQTAYMKAATIGSFPGIINSIIMDDARASVPADWTFKRTMSATTTAVSFYGTDTNSFGTNYYYKAQGGGSSYVQFTPNIIGPGDYHVYQWHPSRANASASVPHIISYNGGTTTVYADQTTNAGDWSLLGTFNFAAGTGGNIRITDGIPESGGVAMADGLKLVFVCPNAPHIDAVNLLPGRQVRLQISGCPGFYAVDAASAPGGWGPLTNIVTTTNRFECTLAPSGQARQFYRARLLWGN
jgi:hypothetical protein